jgi:hypothetical protein
VPDMIIVVKLKGNVIPEEYKRWVMESYVPVVTDLSSIKDWPCCRGHEPKWAEIPPYHQLASRGTGLRCDTANRCARVQARQQGGTEHG